jgi:hypothetical protein
MMAITDAILALSQRDDPRLGDHRDEMTEGTAPFHRPLALTGVYTQHQSVERDPGAPVGSYEVLALSKAGEDPATLIISRIQPASGSSRRSAPWRVASSRRPPRPLNSLLAEKNTGNAHAGSARTAIKNPD